MFFIGATGHFLPLVLTVCLPFVFILSGKQNINISGNSSYTELYQLQKEKSFNQNIVIYDYFESENCDNQQNKFFPREKQKLKIPLINFDNKKSRYFISCCVNKAPPALS